MKKYSLLSLILAQFFISSHIPLAYGEDQIIFEQSDGTEKQVDLKKTPAQDSSTMNNTTSSDSNNDNKDDSDVLFVQNLAPSKPHIDPWMALVQSKNKDYEAIEEALNNGQNVNQVLFDGDTMLILGAMQNNLKEVQLALKYNANTHLQNKDGDLALHWAAGTGNVDIVKVLVSSSNSNSATTKGKSKNTTTNISDTNKTNKVGRTPLHFAALYKPNVDTIEYLLTQPVDINAVDVNGQTPAHFAAAVGRWENLEVLLKHGAKLFIQDKNDLTVEQLILEKADIQAMVRMYPYLSTDGKKQIRDKLSGLPIDWNKPSAYLDENRIASTSSTTLSSTNNTVKK